MRVAIIGSGISAVAVAKRLVTRGIKPVLLDVGEELDSDRAALADRLAEKEPEQWLPDERITLTSNPTVHTGLSIPKKLLFGSDYFYGQPHKHAPLEGQGPLPPFSYAKGGFSVGWGAAVLPPDSCDLTDWPITIADLADHFRFVLSSLPLSAAEDELSTRFPLFTEDYGTLKLTVGNAAILNDLRQSDLLKTAGCLFGQARLLMRAADQDDKPGCKYCGYCMSGCVYGCIYKSLDDVNHLVAAEKVDYISGVLVQQFEEAAGQVHIAFVDRRGEQHRMTVDKVFLAAGAVNSTRIILKSGNLYGHKVRLHTRGGFVVPMLRARHAPAEWPDANTQPGLFLEYKVPGLSDHWVHTQLSTPNEMIFEKLKIQTSSDGLVQKLKRHLLGHVVIAFGNLHSNHAFGYELSLTPAGAGHKETLKYERESRVQSDKDIRQAIRQLRRISWKFGCIPLTPIAQNNTGSYHVGGTLPMKKNPQLETETDLLGRPLNMKHVHVVDSSVFPSLPGTTIGLLAMANADRIAANVLLE